MPLETFLVIPAGRRCSWQCTCGGHQAVTPWMLQGKEQAQGVSASHTAARVSSIWCPRPPSMAWYAPTGILFSGDPVECHKVKQAPLCIPSSPEAGGAPLAHTRQSLHSHPPLHRESSRASSLLCLRASRDSSTVSWHQQG